MSIEHIDVFGYRNPESEIGSRNCAIVCHKRKSIQYVSIAYFLMGMFSNITQMDIDCHLFINEIEYDLSYFDNWYYVTKYRDDLGWIEMSKIDIKRTSGIDVDWSTINVHGPQNVIVKPSESLSDY